VANVTVNVAGSLTNNGTIMANGTNTSSLINMNGTASQTVSGGGVWVQYTTNPGTGVFPGFGVNNAAGVVLNQSFALQNTLNLTNGAISGSGIITLGNGTASTLTTNVGISTGGVVGGTLPVSQALYNLT